MPDETEIETDSDDEAEETRDHLDPDNEPFDRHKLTKMIIATAITFAVSAGVDALYGRWQKRRTFPGVDIDVDIEIDSDDDPDD